MGKPFAIVPAKMPNGILPVMMMGMGWNAASWLRLLLKPCQAGTKIIKPAGTRFGLIAYAGNTNALTMKIFGFGIMIFMKQISIRCNI